MYFIFKRLTFLERESGFVIRPHRCRRQLNCVIHCFCFFTGELNFGKLDHFGQQVTTVLNDVIDLALGM